MEFKVPKSKRQPLSSELDDDYVLIYKDVDNILDDIDFVVDGCKDLLKLERDLESIDTLRKIDIFDYDSIKNPFLLEDIEKYGKQIY